MGATEGVALAGSALSKPAANAERAVDYILPLSVREPRGGKNRCLSHARAPARPEKEVAIDSFNPAT